MSESVIEQLFPSFFKFGKHSNSGMVDVATKDDDTFISCSDKHADKLINERDSVLEMVEKLASALKVADPAAYDNLFHPDVTQYATQFGQVHAHNFYVVIENDIEGLTTTTFIDCMANQHAMGIKDPRVNHASAELRFGYVLVPHHEFLTRIEDAKKSKHNSVFHVDDKLMSSDLIDSLHGSRVALIVGMSQ